VSRVQVHLLELHHLVATEFTVVGWTQRESIERLGTKKNENVPSSGTNVCVAAGLNPILVTRLTSGTIERPFAPTRNTSIGAKCRFAGYHVVEVLPPSDAVQLRVFFGKAADPPRVAL